MSLDWNIFHSINIAGRKRERDACVREKEICVRREFVFVFERERVCVCSKKRMKVKEKVDSSTLIVFVLIHCPSSHLESNELWL